MTWWVLLLVWLVLLLLAVGLVALVGRRTFRRGIALLAEVGAAADRLTAVAEGRPQTPNDAPPPARGAGRSSTRGTR